MQQHKSDEIREYFNANSSGVYNSSDEADAACRLFGVANGERFISVRIQNKQIGNKKIFFDLISASNKSLKYCDKTPFIVLERNEKECDFGQQSFKRPKKEKAMQNGRTKQKPCPAKIIIRRIIKFPQYKVEEDTKYHREQMSAKLRKEMFPSKGIELMKQCGVEQWVVDFPCAGSHKNHQIGVNKSNVNYDDHARTVMHRVCDELGVEAYEKSGDTLNRLQAQINGLLKSKRVAGKKHASKISANDVRDFLLHEYLPASYHFSEVIKYKQKNAPLTVEVEADSLDEARRLQKGNWVQEKVVPQPSKGLFKRHQVVNENARFCQQKVVSQVVNVEMMHEVVEVESNENEIVDLDQYELYHNQTDPFPKPNEVVFLDQQPTFDASQIYLDGLSSVYAPESHAFQEKFSKLQPLPIQAALQPNKRKPTSFADIVAMQPPVAKKLRLQTQDERDLQQFEIVSTYAKNDAYKTKDDAKSFVPERQDPFLSAYPDEHRFCSTLCPENDANFATGESYVLSWVS